MGHGKKIARVCDLTFWAKFGIKFMHAKLQMKSNWEKLRGFIVHKVRRVLKLHQKDVHNSKIGFSSENLANCWIQSNENQLDERLVKDFLISSHSSFFPKKEVEKWEKFETESFSFQLALIPIPKLNLTHQTKTLLSFGILWVFRSCWTFRIF